MQSKSEEIPEPTPPLTPEEQALVAKLSEVDLQTVDATIMASSREQWRKVAMVVATTMHTLEDRYPLLPDLFYAQRLRRLVEQGRLESQGNLLYMRFSEVRLPKTESRFVDET